MFTFIVIMPKQQDDKVEAIKTTETLSKSSSSEKWEDDNRMGLNDRERFKEALSLIAEAFQFEIQPDSPSFYRE